jgi:hypothetical protein
MFSGPQETSRTSFRVIGGFLNAATSSFKRVTGMISRIGIVVIEASQTSNLVFCTTKQPKNVKPSVHMYRKY